MQLHSSLTLLVGLQLACVLLSVSAADLERLRNLNELFGAAQSLESAHLQVTDNRQVYADKRTKLVYSFARESKSALCERHLDQLKKTLEEYRAKAYNFVADSRKPSNWLSGLKRMVGPLGGMKNLAKFDKFLASVTERYESQANSNILSEADVDCDLLKLHIRTLDSMMFVLQTDVKYLIVEDPQVNNIAIYRQLAENKFIASSNFYDNDNLTGRQRELLLQFYASRVDPNVLTIGQALEHFHNPGNLILGRLLESCHKLVDLQAAWRELEASRAPVCAKSRSDLANELFAGQYDLHKYASSAAFCGQFLDSL